MKFLLTLIVACGISTSNANASLSQGAKQFSSVWKSHKHHSLQLDKNDITMGYGGADVVHKPLMPEIAIA